MGYLLRGVDEENCFVNVHLDCIVSNLKVVGKMSTMSPPEKFVAYARGSRLTIL